MRQYLELLSKVLSEGTWQDNRTGIPTIRMDGAMLQFNLADGFPAVTTKKLAFGQVKGELIGFIRGYSNAEQFRKLGCNVWDANANKNADWLNNPNRRGKDDLGRVYGVQWREWIGAINKMAVSPTYRDKGEMHFVADVGFVEIDQLANAVDLICDDPTNRRIIVSAWNPSDMDKMALPPCHMMFQFLVDVNTNELSMCMYQRSCDLFLGIPFNIASYALLLELVAQATNRIPGRLTMFLADVHIYENHIEQVKLQLTREPLPLPELGLDILGSDLVFTKRMQFLNLIEPPHIQLVGYEHHEAIKGDMAI